MFVPVLFADSTVFCLGVYILRWLNVYSMAKFLKMHRPRFTNKTRMLDKVKSNISFVGDGASAVYGEQQAVLVFYRAMGDSTEFTVTVDGKSHDSVNGRAEVVVARGASVEYEVSAEGYATMSGVVTSCDVNKDVALPKFAPVAGPAPVPEQKYIISIASVPASAFITLGDVSGTGYVSAEFAEGSTVSYEVSAVGYESASGSLVVSKDEALNITLSEVVAPPVVVEPSEVTVGGSSDFGTESVAISTLPDLSAAAGMTTIKAASIDLSASFTSPRVVSLVATGDVTVGGTGVSPMVIDGSQPKSQGNASLSITSGGVVSVHDLKFAKDDGAYNALEIGLTKGVDATSVLIEGVTFDGKLLNNAISIFGTADNATIVVRNCTFASCSNAVRLSNRTAATGVSVTFENCHLLESTGEEIYRGFLMMQDHSSTSAADALSRNIFGSDKLSVSFISCTIGTGDSVEVINFASNPALGAPNADGSVNPKQAYYTYYNKGFGDSASQGLMPYVAENYPALSFGE